MTFIKARGTQLILAGPLAAMTIFSVTACGGGSVASPAQGSPGHWTQAEVSQFTAEAGSGGSASQDSCIIGYFERDMAFGNAMDVASVQPASDASSSAVQVKAALISKYGAAKGNAADAQFAQTVTGANSHCDAAAAPSTTPTVAPAPSADPAATSESSCTIDCVNPVASGESGWLAQVQGAVQNVQQDLTAISSDADNDPASLSTDGSQLEGDAQAALDPNNDPPPADNTDWVTAMNDYVTAGEDYSGDNMNEQDDNPAQASQEIGAGNSALASFNAANGGVLDGISPSL